MCGTAAFVSRARRTTRKCYEVYSTVEMWMTRDDSAVADTKARYWSKITNTAIRFGREKLEWCGYRRVKNV